MRLKITSKDNLAQVLSLSGHAVELRCSGRGTCGRCGVRLLSGEWETGGRRITAPADVLACRTRLLSDSGEVEFTPVAAAGQIASGWSGKPLPERDETVIAVDIGTTTIAAAKIRSGAVLNTAGCFNSQNRFGDNVVTRISSAASDLAGLHLAVRDSVGKLLKQLGTDGVSRIAVAGNTVMTLLFHGIDPSPVGVMPFKPPRRVFGAASWGDIPLLTVPCISGFVGGDITAGLYETDLAEGEMLLDIGTNCEIVLNTPDGMVCTAAAAGPAFEGAGLYFGCRAAEGAVDHYFGPGDFSVLGAGEAAGICGSAYVDILAVERRHGRLSEFGRCEPKAEKLNVSEKLFVHERDIEQILKAKAAVRAGIETLEKYCGLKAKKIYLAGGFSRYLDLASAVAIGMLPERDMEIVGNTSLGGAAALAVAPETMTEFEKLSAKPREVQLNTLPGFEDNFIDGLLLP